MASTITTTTKIIVLDDDPTGSQTVHSCLLLTKWDVETLRVALTDDSSPLFFVLTNTRGMSPERAADVTREVCHNLKSALSAIEEDTNKNIRINPMLVSRSDSTLRGHYPVETNIIAEELGPFDAHFLIPAFFEGGRITRNGTHYLFAGDELVPCHETEFAKDSVFGYTTAYLPDYVAEKTKGRISSEQVEHFTLSEVQGDCSDRLLSLTDNTCCVVDCEEQSDLNNFAKQLRDVVARSANANASTTSDDDHPRRFLFRSGASILTSLAMLPPQPIPAEDMCQYTRDGRPGAIVVGSHVKKTSLQLHELLKEESVAGLEIDVARIRNNNNDDEQMAAMLSETVARIDELHAEGKTPVIYTSRTELTDFNSDRERLQFGERVSGFLMDVVERLPTTLGFLISKGGITSNDVLSNGLALRTSRVLGQILPGCSVVKCPSDHPRYPDMPVVIFPGNVGNEFGLVTTFRRLSSTSS
eukprot:jgi/Psemu1/41429/gm1.41429_g